MSLNFSDYFIGAVTVGFVATAVADVSSAGRYGAPFARVLALATPAISDHHAPSTETSSAIDVDDIYGGQFTAGISYRLDEPPEGQSTSDTKSTNQTSPRPVTSTYRNGLVTPSVALGSRTEF